jgi:hypothetical protein
VAVLSIGNCSGLSISRQSSKMQCAGLEFSPRFSGIMLASLGDPGLSQDETLSIGLQGAQAHDFYDGFELPSQFT